MPLLTDTGEVPDLSKTAEECGAPAGTAEGAVFAELSEEAAKSARPAAFYKECFIENRSPLNVSISGVVFKAPFLASLLKEIDRVFPFAVTCGTEIDNRFQRYKEDILKSYYCDRIMEKILSAAEKAVIQTIQARHGLSKTSLIRPGTGTPELWPVKQQTELFKLLGEGVYDTGLRITESGLMRPLKSVSGILFASEKEFSGCEKCGRKNCPSRKTV